MISLNNALLDYAEDLRELNNLWKPLPWQIAPVRALFYGGIKDVGAQCGRSSGKTDMLGYCNWRYAREVPYSENYIFEPLQKQAREILWATNRLQTFGPPDFIKSINNTEMRITFQNGSFIKLDGSDNVDSLRGIKPKGLICYDELKDHKPEFLEAMEPNRARYNAPALYTGTPPEIHNHYVDIMDMLKNDPHSFWCQATSFDNHHNDRDFLERVKTKLIAMGLEDQWMREYLAIFVKGGKRSIFPWVLKQTYKPLAEILPKDLNRWQIVVGFDPASTSTFGVIFLLHNPYTKNTIAFDELYITDPHKMTARAVYDAINEKLEPWKGKVKEVNYVYDEAAAWFRNEVSEIDQKLWLEPSDKSRFGVDGYINLVRNVMHFNLFEIAAECKNYISELEGYIKDHNGKIPKANDHLINASQYALGSLGLDFSEAQIPKVTPLEDLPRAYRMEDDMPYDEYTEIG